MVISREDYLLFMSLIEREIHELYFDRYRETEVIRERQQKLFEKWKELNHANTTDGYTRFYRKIRKKTPSSKRSVGGR